MSIVGTLGGVEGKQTIVEVLGGKGGQQTISETFEELGLEVVPANTEDEVTPDPETPGENENSDPTDDPTQTDNPGAQ